MSAKDDFKINFLDHVAIRVVNTNASVNWYKTVLGLKEYRLKKWGDYPIFMLAGKSGIAIFPAYTNDPKVDAASKNVKLDHFAFNVTQDNFNKARHRFKQLKIKYIFQDHHYFHSLYIKDPDGHTVELTTLLTDPEDFYK